jgi:hypothetical protein
MAAWSGRRERGYRRKAGKGGKSRLPAFSLYTLGSRQEGSLSKAGTSGKKRERSGKAPLQVETPICGRSATVAGGTHPLMQQSISLATYPVTTTILVLALPTITITTCWLLHHLSPLLPITATGSKGWVQRAKVPPKCRALSAPCSTALLNGQFDARAGPAFWARARAESHRDRPLDHGQDGLGPPFGVKGGGGKKSRSPLIRAPLSPQRRRGGSWVVVLFCFDCPQDALP